MSIKTVVRFATFLYWLTSVVCTSQYCDHIFHSSDWQQARILHGLTDVGSNWVNVDVPVASSRIFLLSTESYITGYKTNYTVGVCGSVSRTDSLAAVLQNGTVVLGRVNNTNVVKGGDWMMMTFGSGDFYPENSNCSGARAAFVIINCNHNFSEENSLRFIKEVVQEEKDKKNSCFFFLEIHSQLVCIKPENIGGGTIFSILLLLLILGYIVGGTLYRRYILGAKGLEQIPNYTFWKTMKSKIQGVCSNVFCPRDSRNTSSWENLGARLERDDDSLLPP